MAGPQLTTNAQIPQVFDIDEVTITRYSPNVVAGVAEGETTTIWTGAADLQEDSGDIFYNIQGAVEEIDAVLIIDLQAAGGTLPAVDVDDIVTNAADGKVFAVVAVTKQTFIYPYLELALRRGPLKTDQK
jgi:hypothetical protein